LGKPPWNNRPTHEKRFSGLGEVVLRRCRWRQKKKKSQKSEGNGVEDKNQSRIGQSRTKSKVEREEAKKTPSRAIRSKNGGKKLKAVLDFSQVHLLVGTEKTHYRAKSWADQQLGGFQRRTKAL